MAKKRLLFTATPQGIETAKKALVRLGLGTKTNFANAKRLSRTTVTKFFNRKPIQLDSLQRICEELTLPWREIIDLSENAELEINKEEYSSSSSQSSISDIDALVREVRQRVQPYIQEKCGTMRVLDMTQPIALGDIYTSVNILDKITGRRGLELSELMPDADPEKFERFCLGNVRKRCVPGLEAVETFSKLMILGKPGAGKTTFLKHLAIQCIGGEFQGDRVPVFITLKDFAETRSAPDLLTYIKQREVERYINQYIQNLPDASTDPEALELDSAAVLKSIEALHGMFVERARGIYSFSHLTFHEYFTARKIKESCNPYAADDPTLQELVSHLTEKRWREVFLLTVNLLDSAEALLRLMKARIDELLAEDKKLQQFLKWVDEKARSVDAPYKFTAIRAFYFDLGWSVSLFVSNLNPNPLVTYFKDSLEFELANVLNLVVEEDCFRDTYLYFDLELACAFGDAPTKPDIQNYKLELELEDLLRCLENKILDYHDSLIFTHNFGEDSWQSKWQDEVKSLAQQLRSVMIEHHNIGRDWQFDNAQKRRLQQYYDANKLLMDSLNSDCYVSREVRQEIEETLLLPIAEIKKRSGL